MAARHLLLLAQAARAALHVVVEGLSRRRRRGVFETDGGRVEFLGAVELERIGFLAEPHRMLAAISPAADHQPLMPLLTLQGNKMAGQGDRLDDPASLPMRHQITPILPPWRRGWRGDDLEVRGFVHVGAYHQAIAPIVEVIADVGLARGDQHRLAVGTRGIDQPLLRGIAVRGRDHDEPLGPGAVDGDLEAEIVLLVDLLIACGIGPQAMPIDEARSMIFVTLHVEQRVAGLRPCERCDVGDDLRQVASAADIANAQVVVFGAAVIGEIRVEPVVGTVLMLAERKISLAFGERGSVEQQFLGPARSRHADDRAMLCAGLKLDPVGIGAIRSRYAGFVLLDPTFHLLHELEPQAGERRKYRLRVTILRLDMGANLGLERSRIAQNLAPIGIAQPVIGIDALESMNALTDRPLRRQPAAAGARSRRRCGRARPTGAEAAPPEIRRAVTIAAFTSPASGRGTLAACSNVRSRR